MSEVRVYQRASPGVPAFEHVRGSEGAVQWLLHLAPGTSITSGS
jgi:hypothetical protein